MPPKSSKKRKEVEGSEREGKKEGGKRGVHLARLVPANQGGVHEAHGEEPGYERLIAGTQVRPQAPAGRPSIQSEGH